MLCNSIVHRLALIPLRTSDTLVKHRLRPIPNTVVDYSLAPSSVLSCTPEEKQFFETGSLRFGLLFAGVFRPNKKYKYPLLSKRRVAIAKKGVKR